MWSLAGSQAIDQPFCYFGPGLRVAGWSPALGLSCTWLANPAAMGLWVGQLASAPGAHPPEVSGVGPHSANLGASNQASGERWGCLSQVDRPGTEGGGAPEAVAAAESSLTSP